MTTATLEKVCKPAAPVKNERRTVIPEYKVTQTQEAYEIHAHLPGVSGENLNIELEGQWLKLSGETEKLNVEGLKPLHIEFTERNYECKFKIPNQIEPDLISAKLNNGVLRVRLPKAKEHQKRSITINAS